MRSARRGWEEKRRSRESSSPRRSALATPGATAGGQPAGGRRSWTAFPILPECPNVCSAQPGSVCVRVYVCVCVCARVCACVCAARAPRRVEAHSLMRAGTERQHCSFPRTPAASRAATCERRAGSGASTPGTAPLPARRQLRAAPAASRTVSTGHRARPATRKLQGKFQPPPASYLHPSPRALSLFLLLPPQRRGSRAARRRQGAAPAAGRAVWVGIGMVMPRGKADKRGPPPHPRQAPSCPDPPPPVAFRGGPVATRGIRCRGPPRQPGWGPRTARGSPAGPGDRHRSLAHK